MGHGQPTVQAVVHQSADLSAARWQKRAEEAPLPLPLPRVPSRRTDLHMLRRHGSSRHAPSKRWTHLSSCLQGMQHQCPQQHAGQRGLGAGLSWVYFLQPSRDAGSRYSGGRIRQAVDKGAAGWRRHAVAALASPCSAPCRRHCCCLGTCSRAVTWRGKEASLLWGKMRDVSIALSAEQGREAGAAVTGKPSTRWATHHHELVPSLQPKSERPTRPAHGLHLPRGATGRCTCVRSSRAT